LNITDPERRSRYNGAVKTDSYGRQAPKDAHGSINLPRHTSSAKIITEHMMQLFERVVDPDLLVRKITVTANHVLNEKDARANTRYAIEDKPGFVYDAEADKTDRKKRPFFSTFDDEDGEEI
jgi:DNA polymerase V